MHQFEILMSGMPHTFDFLLRVLGLIAVPFTLTLAWAKIGHRVSYNYVWGTQGAALDGVKSVTLINQKDRSLVVFSMHAVLDDLSIPLKKFDPPLIIKGLEAVRVDIDPVSEYTIDGEEFEFKLPLASGAKFEIFLEAPSKTVQCKFGGASNQFSFSVKRKLRRVVPMAAIFNGRVYSKRIRYAVVYIDGDRGQKTSFIWDTGMIDWDLSPKFIQQSHMVSAGAVKAALERDEVGKTIAPFFVEQMPPR